MAASLSSPQPANPRKQKLNRARLNPLVNNLMMSMTLTLIAARAFRRAGIASSQDDDRAGPSFMLLEPRQGGKAGASSGTSRKHQPVPGSGLVEPPHLLSESGQPLKKLRARLQPERLDRGRLVMDRRSFWKAFW